ncbi:MAG: delta 1-pyrroline-5-carboxylate reductase [Bogoriella megaspora]|nr:MAG: delta 1-pyrroline-5-carboxylate reductase [Bogoriella megaspora]
MAQADGVKGLTLTVLGCGTMGIAILSGIIASLDALKSQHTDSQVASPSPELPERLPTRFIACVRSAKSVNRIRSSLPPDAPLTILENDNLQGVKQADVVLLGCKPHMREDVLGADGIRDALSGKLLISILAGVTASQIRASLYGAGISTRATRDSSAQCTVVRAMPNTASFVRESMTVIERSEPPPAASDSNLVAWIFSQIGRVVRLAPGLMDVSTAVCGSSPAFMALVAESMADGAVAMGLPRAEAQLMVAQVMRGTAGLMLNGEHPAVLKDKVSTPGGCTIGGLLVLEEGNARGTMARAIREATVVASQLGQGAQGVNGTRW